MAGSIDYSTPVVSITGEPGTLEDYRGKAMLIVNTASQCGFTFHYDGLQALHERYADDGLVVLGFPCNQFGGQEPGSEGEIADFCRVNHGVTFPLHQKIDVNGSDAHPLFRQLKKAAPGLLGTQAIKWNFTKFLVDREGRVVARFAPNTKPKALASRIESVL